MYIVTSQQFQTYQSLKPYEQKILQLLSLCFVETSQSQLLRMIHSIGLETDEMEQVNLGILQDFFEQCQKKQLIQKRSSSKYTCEATLRDCIIDPFENEALFARMISEVYAFCSYNQQEPWGWYKSGAITQLLRVVYYDGDVERFAQLIAMDDVKAAYDDGIKEFFSTHTLFHLQFEWFASIPLYFQKMVMAHAFTLYCSKGWDVTLLINYTQSILTTDASWRSGYEILSSCLILQGKISALEKLLPTVPDHVLYLYIEASLLCVHGDFGKASEAFASGIKQERKLTKKNTIRPSGVYGMLYIFCLIAEEQTGFKKEMEKVITYNKKADTEFSALYEMFELFAPLQLGRKLEHRNTLIGLPASQFVLGGFVSGCLLSWFDASGREAYSEKIQAARELMQVNKNMWLVEQLGEVLEIEENSSTYYALCKSFTPPQPWQYALETMKVLASGSSAGNMKKERVIWIIHELPEEKKKATYLTIQPKLQVLSAKGNWSSGRNISIKKLGKGPDIAALTTQDRKVSKAVEEEYNYYNYGSREWTLNASKALVSLVGHPLVFSTDGDAIELVKHHPELLVESVKDGLKCTFKHVATSDEVVIKKLNDRQYVVHEPHEMLSKIKQSFTQRGSIIFPKSAESELKTVLASMTHLVNIHSDVDIIEAADQHIETREAVKYLTMRIIPHEKVFDVHIVLQPLPGSDKKLVPGKGAKSIYLDHNGKKILCQRDLTFEKDVYRRLLESCLVLNEYDQGNFHWSIDTYDDFLDMLLDAQSMGEQLVIEWPKGKKITVRNKVDFKSVSLKLKEKNDWLSVSGSIQIDADTQISLQECLELIQKEEGRFVRLDDGSLFSLTKQLQKELGYFASVGKHSKGGVDFHQSQALSLEESFEAFDDLKASKIWKKKFKALTTVTDVVAVPATFEATFRSYQMKGYQWLCKLREMKLGACLADDMGLGKTVQVIGMLLHGATHGPHLVVVPASLIHNWKQEIERFAPTLRAVSIRNSADRSQVIADLKPYDVLIISYGLMVQEIDALKAVTFDTIVFDEAQAIKNAKSQRSKAARLLVANFRVLTTGTPIENHLGELWSLFTCMLPGLLGTEQQFQRQFALPIEKDRSTFMAGQLKRLISPFLLRRKKSDVLTELPDKTEITIEVEMSKDHLALYEATRVRALQKVESALKGDAKGGTHLKVLAELMRLRQACCHPKLVLPDSKIPSSKLTVLAGLLEDIISSGHKVLIFSQFVGFLKKIESFVQEQSYSYHYLDGQTAIGKRKKLVDSFQEGNADVFLISLKAGGVGLNLTAASYVIHMDPWWNPAVENQASDRAHRIGQKQAVTVYRLITQGTIEEKIIALHQQKKDLADQLLDGTDVSGRLSAVELVGLIRGD